MMQQRDAEVAPQAKAFRSAATPRPTDTLRANPYSALFDCKPDYSILYREVQVLHGITFMNKMVRFS